MAIKLEREIGDTGVVGDYWAPTDLHLQLNEDGTRIVTALYRLWVNEKAFRSGKQAIRGAKCKVRAVVKGANPSLRDIEAALDDAAMQTPVEAVPPLAPVEAQPAVKEDKAKGIKARPAIKAKPGAPAIPASPGGALHGGQIA